MRMLVGILVGVALVSHSGYGKDEKLNKDAPKAMSSDDFTVADKTRLDFTDTMVEGKMQAPNGFFLQGRQPQSLMQMVKLRTNFRHELRNSKSAVKSLVR